ncbi:MerR family transcriptional regulator [Massilia sp. S19_KUP03_FR1]|uniref:MerR family transcriptional regulator n=1 Tax=Massilia sp. S19_KUP03_FR1 TaxID=3025503 RepID=UPI002FCDBBC5
MLLKIGDLAKRTGLTVRALHHYDSIGLLTPSARSDAGYRLYTAADIARLHQVLALRQCGLSLADIGTTLTTDEIPLAAIVSRQIAMLEQQIAGADALRARLQRLQGQLAGGQEPDLADWLTTLEQMTMFDKYFTPEELKELPLYEPTPAITEAWQALVAAVQAQMDGGARATDPEPQALAQRWMHMVKRDTANNPVLFAKLNAMHEQEPALQASSGVTPALMQFVLAATHESKTALYRPYLDDAEFAFLRDNIGKRGGEWPPLIAKVRQAMQAGQAPVSPEGQALALQWFDLFRSFAGDNPATQAKIRKALVEEPRLTDGGMVDAAMRDYIRTAMQSLAPGSGTSA